MPYSQDHRVASVTAPADVGPLLLYRMSGTEQLSRLFEYELELLSESNSVNLQGLLGKDMTVKLELADGGYRYFNGLVTRVSQFGMLGNLYYYRATLQPKVWLLTRANNCRIMPEPASVPVIVKTILSGHGYTDVDDSSLGTYPTREYCVQYRETDFNFISRLLEEEGIYYYFKHSDGNHTLVLCDSMDSHEDIPGKASIRYFPMANQEQREEENIYEWSLSQTIQSGAYRLNEFDFEAPGADLKTEAVIAAGHEQADKEVYDYPGEYKESGDGNRLANIRMEELRAEFERISARGNVRRLAVGHKFSLTDYPREDQNRPYLAVSTQFQIQNNGYESYGIANSIQEYQCAYTVIATEYVFRPPRLSRVPIVQGVQTAIVVGRSGEEITTDSYGRVKVQFHWDRLGTNNENSSCWVRVAQIWAGKNWGGMFIPRVGQEVIVDFLEGNPDCPIITGRVYNADQMPPYDLDANKTQSGIKTRSTPSGGTDNFNEIRFEDKAGEEEVYMHAEKNFTRIVENNDVQKIGFEKKDAGDQAIDIYNNRTVTLDQGNDLLTVKTGNRTVKVDKGKIAEEAAQSIELKVGGSSIKIEPSGITIKGMTIKIQADTSAELKGLQTTVSGDGMLTLKGGLVKIN
jgi:type VI secretion system secreted protein VgrG